MSINSSKVYESDSYWDKEKIAPLEPEADW